MNIRLTCPNCSPHSSIDCEVWMTLDPLVNKMYWMVTCKKCKEEFTIKFEANVFLSDKVWDKLGRNKEPMYNNRGQHT